MKPSSLLHLIDAARVHTVQAQSLLDEAAERLRLVSANVHVDHIGGPAIHARVWKRSGTGWTAVESSSIDPNDHAWFKVSKELGVLEIIPDDAESTWRVDNPGDDYRLSLLAQEYTPAAAFSKVVGATPCGAPKSIASGSSHTFGASKEDTHFEYWFNA